MPSIRYFGACTTTTTTIMLLLSWSTLLFRRSASAWVPLPSHRRAGRVSYYNYYYKHLVQARSQSQKRTTVLSRNHMEIDDQGRRIRGGGGRRTNDDDDFGGWDDFDPTVTAQNSPFTTSPAANDSWDDDYDTDNSGPSRGQNSRRTKSSRPKNDWDDSWDSFDPLESSKQSPQRTQTTPRRRVQQDDWDDDFDSRRRRRSSGSGSNRSNEFRRQQQQPDGIGRSNYQRDSPRRGGSGDGRAGPPPRKKSPEDRKINMKALEGAGFVHLYGLAPVLNALRTGKRDFTRPEDRIDLTDLAGEELEHEKSQRERKPEAQYSPWLFVQEQYNGGRAKDKRAQAEQVMELAKERGVPVASVDKGVLNTLSGNRPHQGYVLRCGKLFFESLSRIPLPDDGSPHSLWLVLDEVVDPQNLGALIRSAFFLGAGSVNVVVCAKNSAPPSPAVSAASAGALELVNVYSTSNLPRTLASAEQDGFRIIGASSSVPQGVDESCVFELGEERETEATTKPTILVLGSEGHGLRSLVARSCTEFVRIGGGGGDPEGVDSLNVSVTGGILLWHFLQSMKK